jgi:DNA invertase Pin-like site-specific DNA recombinase
MPSKKATKLPDRRVALCYVRQSQTRDENDMDSPERQRENITLACQQHGWTPEWYEDVDGHRSGTKVKNRPGWLALKARLADPDVAALVANDLSRLHRKGWRVGDLLDFVRSTMLIWCWPHRASRWISQPRRGGSWPS